MRKLESFLSKQGWESTKLKVSLSDIRTLENKNNKVFPLAYRQYLLLTGYYFPPFNLNHFFENLEKYNVEARLNLKKYKLEHLIKKEFWVVANSSSESIIYIHYDDGDNPSVYGISMEDYDDKPSLSHVRIADTFQEWIEKWIEKYDSERRIRQQK